MSARTILKHLHQQGRMTDYQFDVINRNLRERPQGEWNCTFHSSFPQYEPDEYRCSICNGRGGKLDKFCKHCGAEMGKGEENE